MTDPSSLALQKSIRARLVGTLAITSLVPASNIVDSHGRPSRFPSINLGETQLVADDLTYERNHVRVYATMHVWTEENSLVEVKRIAGAVRASLRSALDVPGFIDGQIEEERFIRDPDGEHAHGIVTYAALIEEPVE